MRTTPRRFPVTALLVMMCLPALSLAGGPPPAGMLRIPASRYTPLFKSDGARDVPAFYLDEIPVTNDAFLDFVRANPDWRRSHVKRLFADKTYLRHWKDDLDLGPNAALLTNSPVTHVSWFAATAYARWQNKRLPTLAEWEVTAGAGLTNAVGNDDPSFNQRILDWYSHPQRPIIPPVRSTAINAFGIWDMHGLVWEWVWDFNTALVTGESRADSGLDRQQYCGGGSINASDFQNYAGFMREAFRSSLQADFTVANLGFRCAKDVEPE